MKAAGQIARTDELRAEVARAEADREVKKAARDVNLASIALKSTLGGEVDAVPTTPLALITGLEPRATFSATADSGNPTIGRLAALREQAHQGVRAARGELFPSVSVFGTGELIEQGLNSTADPKWVVGVGARWELFDGLARLNRLTPPVTRRRRSASSTTMRGTRWPRWSSSATTNTSRRWSNTSRSRPRVALAEESLRSERKAYEAAVGTSLDVIDARALALPRAGRSPHALYDLDLALARLLEASGQSDRFLEYPTGRRPRRNHDDSLSRASSSASCCSRPAGAMRSRCKARPTRSRSPWPRRCRAGWTRSSFGRGTACGAGRSWRRSTGPRSAPRRRRRWPRATRRAPSGTRRGTARASRTSGPRVTTGSAPSPRPHRGDHLRPAGSARARGVVPDAEARRSRGVAPREPRGSRGGEGPVRPGDGGRPERGPRRGLCRCAPRRGGGRGGRELRERERPALGGERPGAAQDHGAGRAGVAGPAGDHDRGPLGPVDHAEPARGPARGASDRRHPARPRSRR